MVHVIDFLKNEVKKTCLLDIGKNHKINLIFGYENSIMELFTTIIILIYEIDDTRDTSALFLSFMCNQKCNEVSD